jgi:hypothetical protein
MAFTPRLKADGTPCCFRTLDDGHLAFPANACQPCKDHAAARYRAACAADELQERRRGDNAPPASYLLRAASDAHLRNPSISYEAHLKILGEQAVQDVARRLAANPPARLTTAEEAELLSSFAAPDGYAEGLKLLAKENR